MTGFLRVLRFPLPKPLIPPTSSSQSPRAVSRGLDMSWSHSQGVLLTVLHLVTEMKWKVSWRRPRPKIWLLSHRRKKVSLSLYSLHRKLDVFPLLQIVTHFSASSMPQTHTTSSAAWERMTRLVCGSYKRKLEHVQSCLCTWIYVTQHSSDNAMAVPGIKLLHLIQGVPGGMCQTSRGCSLC
jgi:hypothetical protein